MIRKIIRWIQNAIITFISLVVLYFLLAVLLTIIPTNSNYKPPGKGISIYLISNKVHTDFVLPVNTQQKDWQKVFPDTTFGIVDSSFKYISFGWGDKDFYLNTPTWADLKWNIAFIIVSVSSNPAITPAFASSMIFAADRK